MIDKVYILHLPRCQDRFIFSVDRLVQMGVPGDKIKIWEAIDNLDFEKTLQVRDAMLADGFLEADKWFSDEKYRQYPLAYFCQGWSYCRWYRHIAQTDETALLVQDRRGLQIPFEKLLREISVLQESDPDFLYASLRCDCVPYYEPNWVSEDSLWAYGTYDLSAPDWGLVMTKAGAEKILRRVFDFGRPLSDEFFQNDTFSRNSEHVYSLAGYHPTLPVSEIKAALREGKQGFEAVGFTPDQLKSVIHNTNGNPIRPVETTI